MIRRNERRRRRRDPSSPASFKCSMDLLTGFFVVLFFAYLAALSSLLCVDENSMREQEWSPVAGRGRGMENDRHADRHPIDERFDTGHGTDNEELEDDGYKADGSNSGHVHSNVFSDDENDGRITIGVASTITRCGSESSGSFNDGAAVLKYSLDVHGRSVGSKFEYRTYIFYDPSAEECALPLERLGYTLLERRTPVEVEDIAGDALREGIAGDGCCGEKELIKLEAFRLIEHPIVIHIDLDALLLKPMDDVLDFMMNPKRYKQSPELLSKIPIMWPEKDIPNDIAVLFTKDYNAAWPKQVNKPYQGGFFVIKPSLETYDEFVGIVREGDYDLKKGWGKTVGHFWGGMTIQGLLPWYFEYLHPGRSVELNRCKYNNMNDNPYSERKKKRQCRTNEDRCEDCRYTKEEDVATFHFTICQKPWKCQKRVATNPGHHLCRVMNRKWMRLRGELEASWGRNHTGTGTYLNDYYLGFCTDTGYAGYQAIRQPYGTSG